MSVLVHFLTDAHFFFLVGTHKYYTPVFLRTSFYHCSIKEYSSRTRNA